MEHAETLSAYGTRHRVTESGLSKKALAGLNTTPDAFTGTGLPALALILGAAIVGKVLGSGGGARIAGLGWGEAFAVGSLMNARGLMELIVMKILAPD